MARNILSPDWFGSLDQMLDDMPQNRCLYRDSGLWRISDKDNNVALYEQGVNEDFDDFIRRAYDAENVYLSDGAEASSHGGQRSAGLPMAPLYKHKNNAMSNESNDKQSTESGGADGKPAVRCRASENGVRKELWLRGLNGDEAHTVLLHAYKSLKGYRAQDRSILSTKRMAPYIQANWSRFTSWLDRHGFRRGT